MTPNILCQASRSLIVRAVNVTMRAFQKAGQFQLSSVNDGILARRRYTKKSTDSCSSTSSSTTTTTTTMSAAVVPSTLPHTRRLCGNGVCRCRHAPGLGPSSFDFSDERLSQLTSDSPPKRYGMTLRSRTTLTPNLVVVSGGGGGPPPPCAPAHEFASPAPPPPLQVVCSLSNDPLDKRPLTSPTSLPSNTKKVKRSATITIDD